MRKVLTLLDLSLSVLPKPPSFRGDVGRTLGICMKGVEARSNINCAIVCCGLMVIGKGVSLRSRTIISPR